jgi:hypothetical protein
MDFKTSHEPSPVELLGSRQPRPSVVIADRGDAAWLVVLDPAISPRVGTRFQHRGVTWEVTRPRGRERTWVAEPVSH